jgi:hypothetical protein
MIKDKLVENMNKDLVQKSPVFQNMVEYMEHHHASLCHALSEDGLELEQEYEVFKTSHPQFDKGFDEFKRIFDLLNITRSSSTTRVYGLEGVQLFEVRENDYYRSPCYYLMVMTDDQGHVSTKKVSSLFAKKMVAGNELVDQPYCHHCKKPYRMSYTPKDKDCCNEKVRELSVVECWRDDLVGIECAIAEMQRYNLYKLHFENLHDSECESKPKEEPKPRPKIWDF